MNGHPSPNAEASEPESIDTLAARALSKMIRLSAAAETPTVPFHPRPASVTDLRRQVGRRYAAATLENFEIDHPAQRAVVEQLRRFASDIRRHAAAGAGLILYGPSGTGKDHLTAALLYAAAEAGLSCRYMLGVELYANIRDSIDSGREGRFFSDLALPDILALSDPVLPDADVSAHNRLSLYRIVAERYREQRSTWISCNARHYEEAADLLGLAVLDRVMDASLRLECMWPSKRKERRLSL